MQFDSVLIAPRRDAMRAAGHWRDIVVTDCLDRAVAEVPDKPALVAYRADADGPTRLTYRELGQLVDRLAHGLIALGVERDDVVSLQLPNWWEFTALYLACTRIGAVTNPLMPIFRQRELTFMLGHAEASLLVVPARYRGFDYPAMAEEVRAAVPSLRHVLVAGGAGSNGLEAALLDREFGEDEAGSTAATLDKRRPAGDDVTQVIFTSGTTGDPKGVMHTPNTLLSVVYPFIDRLGLGRDDVTHMASPLAHQSGFLYGMVMPVMLGATAVLQDVFEPHAMAAQIVAEGATFTMGATPFLHDLTEVVASSGPAVPTLRRFVSAGAPIPRALVAKARETLEADVISAWGMTENGGVTTTRPDDPEDTAVNTDGCCVPGMEVRVIDEAGRPVPAGEEGRLQARGCANFAGYLKRPDLNATDAEGWFETGDLARMDADGYIRISGRAKDIIIRGGENVPVVEIENLLYRLPAVDTVAIVGYSDPRLGERACAFVTLRPGAALTLGDVTAYLEAQNVARPYHPERLEVLDDMPRTPSGKVQKFVLRERAKAFAGSRAAVKN